MARKRTWLVATLVASLTAFGTFAIAPNGAINEATAADDPAAQPRAALQAADQLSDAFAYVAETIAPSVVVVRSVREVETQQVNIPPQLRRFFGPDGPFGMPDDDGESRQPRLQMGQGSGFIVSEDGYILTNNHVVENATDVTVILPNDEEYTAEVIGADPQTDVAVIKIDAAEYLNPVRFGNSDELRVGQWVVAAGNPLGLASSITAGIVSAKGRTRLGLTDYEDFIQTDAAINQGNSGGPLVNLRGEVVGINTAIFSRTGGNMGIGFAIPIKLGRHIMDELITTGRIVRGWLGVRIQDLNEGLARSFGFEGTDGVLIGEVTANSPAESAGLRTGDIIASIDGRHVIGVDELRMMVADIDPGTTVEFEVYRNGQTETLDVEIGEMPTEIAANEPAETNELDLGMSYQTLTPGIAGRLGQSENLRGVVVTGVETFSAAARAGLREGDIIIDVQGKAVVNAREFREEMQRHDLTDGVRLTVRSGDTQRFVFLQKR